MRVQNYLETLTLVKVCAASQLPGSGLTDVDDAPAPA